MKPTLVPHPTVSNLGHFCDILGPSYPNVVPFTTFSSIKYGDDLTLSQAQVAADFYTIIFFNEGYNGVRRLRPLEPTIAAGVHALYADPIVAHVLYPQAGTGTRITKIILTGRCAEINVQRNPTLSSIIFHGAQHIREHVMAIALIQKKSNADSQFTAAVHSQLQQL